MSLEEEKFFSQHIRVEDVKLEGLGRTKEHIVLREVDQLKKAGTLKEIKDAMLTARSNLEALNIFDAVQLTLDSGHRVSVIIYLVELIAIYTLGSSCCCHN